MTQKSETAWLLYALLSMVAWGIWGFLPKIALQSLPPDSVIFYESLGNLIPAITIFFLLPRKLEANMPGLRVAALASFLASASILAYLYALNHGQAVVVITLTAMYPVITILMAWGILKEKISRQQCAAIFLAMVSIYLLAS